jgi:hypothetical protein
MTPEYGKEQIFIHHEQITDGKKYAGQRERMPCGRTRHGGCALKAARLIWPHSLHCKVIEA